jgi:mono/diheme cytochrome c family protein
MRGFAICLVVLLVSGGFAAAADAPPDGKALYAAKCAMCHGADGVAKAAGKGSRNFNDPAYQATVEEIATITADGKNKMPKYAGKLTPEEIKAIAEHVKSLAPKK